MTVTHAPQTLEESIVGYLAVQEGCVKEAVIPPPQTCSDLVQAANLIADWHLLSIVIIGFFVVMLMSLLMMAINFGK